MYGSKEEGYDLGDLCPGWGLVARRGRTGEVLFWWRCRVCLSPRLSVCLFV